MKYLLSILMMFFLTLSFSQKTVYHTSTCSVASLNEDSKTIEWPKSEKVEIVLVLDVDTTYDESDDEVVNRKIILYSAQYREFILGEFTTESDNSGNAVVIFDATDLDGIQCSVKLIYLNKKSYVIIQYSDVAVKYTLKKGSSTSVLIKEDNE
jgi:hypothetical protein